MKKNGELKGTDIGKRFLTNLDKYLKNYRKKLTCDDIFKLYYEFCFGNRDENNHPTGENGLPKYRGNSNGFTGLSELIIFRLLYHYFGIPFKLEAKTEQLKYFTNSSHNLKIGQSIPLKIGRKTIYPDISISSYYSDKLLAVIEIKLYFSGGSKTIKKTFQRFFMLRKNNSQLKTLLIIFELSQKGSMYEQLQKYRNKKNKKWFDFIILKNNKEEKLSEKIQKSLNLDKIAKI